MKKVKVRKGVKVCSRCGTELKANLKNFYSDVASRAHDNLSNNCKECQKYYAYDWRKKNYTYHKMYQNLKHRYDSGKITEKVFRNAVENVKAAYL